MVQLGDATDGRLGVGQIWRGDRNTSASGGVQINNNNKFISKDLYEIRSKYVFACNTTLTAKQIISLDEKYTTRHLSLLIVYFTNEAFQVNT